VLVCIDAFQPDNVLVKNEHPAGGKQGVRTSAKVGPWSGYLLLNTAVLCAYQLKSELLKLNQSWYFWIAAGLSQECQLLCD
jgi:hypothetical protein